MLKNLIGRGNYFFKNIVFTFSEVRGPERGLDEASGTELDPRLLMTVLDVVISLVLTNVLPCVICM